MKKEFVEIELHINGKPIILEKQVKIQFPKKGRSFAYLKLEDIGKNAKALFQADDFFSPWSFEIWVREVKNSSKNKRKKKEVKK